MWNHNDLLWVSCGEAGVVCVDRLEKRKWEDV
jgi:hypothetical protein